ncbi:MAG TPA: acetate--CoA ligase family protein, partial [Nitrososphaera sp.]|nr:acetate--CoA ligase family protein [Nitrososphaera sp.]
MVNGKVQQIFNDVYSTKEKVITEELAKHVLTEYGVKVPKYALVKSADEAGTQAQQVGFPLVAKIVSPQILHKTDVKGVKVGLHDEAAVKEAFNDMYGRLSAQYNVKGVLLEKMAAPGGIELIIGLQNDPQFGPVIMAGIGGIYTEVFKDVSFRVLPITKEDAINMIEDLRGNKILKGFRGIPPVNMDMLAEALVNIGKFGTEMAPFYESVDFNPVIFYENDYVVVDAKILLREKPDPNVISK